MSPLSRREFTLSVVGAAAAAAAAARRAPQAEPRESDRLAALSLAQAADAVRSKKVSPVDLVSACLARIEVYNPKLNAFITVLGASALAQANTLETEQRAGSFRGPLHGIPVALKDNFDMKGVRTTAASAVFDDRIAETVSLDHCGPMTRTVEDAAILLNALAGYDRLDIASVEHPAEDYVAALDQPVSGFRLGIPRGPFFDLLDADVARAVDDALAVLEKLTRNQVETALPPTGEITLSGETYAYHEEFFTRTPNRYMIPTRRTLSNGASAKASDYVKARWKLELLRRTIDDSFRDIDLVVLPTRRRTPRTVEAAIQREETDVPRNPELENTGAFNLYGIPAISVPCGFTSSDLPVGLMIAGPRFSEGKVLALARAFERATEWHQRKPPLRPDLPVPPLATTEETRGS
jgi:Asp-tRNA(Asn)/Glu-tRNA(Gln) amidotransferase A subunit family amidase